MAKIHVIHGPNLHALGTREPHLYGADTLASLNQRLTTLASKLGHSLRCHQSNAEHELIELIHESDANMILINPAAYTHTSIALRDALLAKQIPFIEVHLTNIYTREVFRQHSYFSDIAVGVISGLGTQGYELALQAAHTHLSDLAGETHGHTKSQKTH